MEWIERMNRAINYMEEMMEKDIQIDEAAKVAGCSSYHFQRMFAYMADITLSQYIRRRRMSLAAVDLQNGEKVIDVAMKYGYESPTAFNRAFKSVHQVTPSQAQKEGTILKGYPPISFQIMIKGAAKMEYKIVKKDEFRIIGVSAPLDHELEKNFEVVPKMWQQAVMEGTVNQLESCMNGEPAGLLGISFCPPQKDWKYFIAVASDAPVQEGWEEATIPAATWAVFPGTGNSEAIQEHEKRIVLEWLPSSGYEYGAAPDLEVYLNADPENSKYEVWIPVVKK